MTKHFCDLCGGEISKPKDMRTLSITKDGEKNPYATNVSADTCRLEICVDCAVDIISRIKR